MSVETLSIAELVRAFRHRAGITQSGLAGSVGLSARWVRDIERGQVPSAAALRRIAALMEGPGMLSSDLARALRAATSLSVQEVRSLTFLIHGLEARLESVERKLEDLRRRVECMAAAVNTA